MKKDDLYKAIDSIDDSFLEESLRPAVRKRKRSYWPEAVAAAAAVFLLIFGATYNIMSQRGNGVETDAAATLPEADLTRSPEKEASNLLILEDVMECRISSGYTVPELSDAPETIASNMITPQISRLKDDFGRQYIKVELANGYERFCRPELSYFERVTRFEATGMLIRLEGIMKDGSKGLILYNCYTDSFGEWYGSVINYQATRVYVVRSEGDHDTLTCGSSTLYTAAPGYRITDFEVIVFPGNVIRYGYVRVSSEGSKTQIAVLDLKDGTQIWKLDDRDYSGLNVAFTPVVDECRFSCAVRPYNYIFEENGRNAVGTNVFDAVREYADAQPGMDVITLYLDANYSARSIYKAGLVSYEDDPVNYNCIIRALLYITDEDGSNGRFETADILLKRRSYDAWDVIGAVNILDKEFPFGFEPYSDEPVERRVTELGIYDIPDSAQAEFEIQSALTTIIAFCGDSDGIVVNALYYDDAYNKAVVVSEDEIVIRSIMSKRIVNENGTLRYEYVSFDWRLIKNSEGFWVIKDTGLKL